MTDFEEGADFVRCLYHYLLKRKPQDEELLYWTNIAMLHPAVSLIKMFGESEEYKNRDRVRPEHELGHYYSPIVDPTLVCDYVDTERRLGLAGLTGISLEADQMVEMWSQTEIAKMKSVFRENKTEGRRFYFINDFFSYGDAISLFIILQNFRPSNIIEIGSGFSTACFLDALDAIDLAPSITLIEPNPERVLSLLRESDISRCLIYRRNVQDIEIDIFEKLGKNDILFIDSTHVLKTGSDVHFELTRLLPSLRQGVIVHFHDIHYPFEYPSEWIFEDNKSWNEAYALRIFLTMNPYFEILFWGSFFVAEHRDIVAEAYPEFLINPGGSIWIRRK